MSSRKHEKRTTIYLVSVLIIAVIATLLFDFFVFNSNTIGNIQLPEFNINLNGQEQVSGMIVEESSRQMHSDIGIKITDVHVNNGLARAFIKNTGQERIKIVSLVLYDKNGNKVPTDTSLERIYTQGETDALTFTDTTISCSTFSKIVVETNKKSVSDIFDRKPSNC